MFSKLNKGRLLPFYFFTGFLRYFLTSASVFVFIMVMASFLSIVNEDGVMNGFSQYFLFKSLIWLLPSILASSLPFAFVMAVMLSFSEFESSGELKAALAGGFSYRELFSSVLSFSFLLAFMLLLLNSWLGPLGAGRSREYVRTMFGKVTNVNFSSETFEKVSDFSVYAGRVSLGGQLRDIKLFKKEKEYSALFSISASSGALSFSDDGISMELSGGRLKFFSYDRPSSFYDGEFSGYTAFMPFYSSAAAARRPSIKELTSFQLIALPREDLEYRFQGLRQVFFRLSGALSPLAFFFAAFSLSVFFAGKGKFMAFALSLIVVFSYYGLSVGADFLSSRLPELFPWITALPFVTVLVAGLMGWKKIGVRL